MFSRIRPLLNEENLKKTGSFLKKKTVSFFGAVFSFLGWCFGACLLLLIALLIACVISAVESSPKYDQVKQSVSSPSPIIADDYFGDSFSLKIANDNSFEYQDGGKTYTGKIEDKENSTDFMLESWPKMTLCKFNGSDLLILEREECPCGETTTVFKKECTVNKLVRKGSLPKQVIERLEE
jgi:hypothetical protein